MRVDGDREATGLEDAIWGSSSLEPMASTVKVSTAALEADFVLRWTRNESTRGRNGDARGSVSTQPCRFPR